MRLIWQYEKTKEFIREAMQVVGAQDRALAASIRDFHPEDGALPVTVFREAVTLMRRIATAG